jgi:Tfp pilus assembly protein PilZ
MDITKKLGKNRIDKRKPYSGHIFGSSKSGLFEGELKNYSENGLFIKTNEDLTVGEMITVALPFVEDEQIKLHGQIRWRNSEGYGVELIKKRIETDQNLSKIDAKLRRNQQM